MLLRIFLLEKNSRKGQKSTLYPECLFIFFVSPCATKIDENRGKKEEQDKKVEKDEKRLKGSNI